MLVLGPAARLDPEKQLLVLGERQIALQRKPYLVLQYLIENRHRMILRKELLDRFWDGQEVYDQSLSKAVGSIRKAFGETRTGSLYIETRWGLGYRYVGPFGEPPLETAPAAFANTDRSPDRNLGRRIGDSAHTGDGQSAIGSGSLLSHAANGVAPVPSIPMPVEELIASEAVAPAAEPMPIARWIPHGKEFWRKSPWRRWLVYAAAALAIFLILIAIRVDLHNAEPGKTSEAATPSFIRSVAVLPFTAETGKEEDQYLGLGLADAVAAKLGTVPQLSVRSSTTVRSILGTHPDTASAGSRLQVQALVKGELHRVMDKVDITVRLIESNSGRELWSGRYHADDSNIFATEDSIAQQVSIALLPQFGGSAVKTSPGPDTVHPEAYSEYMKAEFFASTRTQNSLAKAVDLLKQAILIDPNYARAYAALADCYQLQGFYEFAPPAEAYPRAKAAALKALSLDSSIAEAHVSLLSTLADYDWDWPGVEREFKAAVAIDPNYAVAYQYYGYALLGEGRGEEALTAMKHAAELDPVSPSVQASLAWAYFLLRRYEQAVDQGKRVLELYPDFVPAHQLLGIVYGQMRADERAMAELNRALTLEKDGPITPILIDYELARSGKRDEASRRLAEFLAKSKGAEVPDYYLAAAWTAVGNKEKALTALERAFELHSNWVIYLQYDPRFDALRLEPRFLALVQRVRSPRDGGR
jgi:TolB-like protein/tetratricopeptide (TPR) repeat protein/DNA-binding winged helix-turn-helix (wHTH) protein